MIFGSLLILSVFFMPLWSITLEAPQYPEPLGMLIWVNKITDLNPNDIQNINILNHYVGMKEIPEHMKEFDLFPWVIIFMSALGVVLGFLGKRNLYLVWFGLMIVLGLAGLYDFYLWQYSYGHDLDPTAAIKFMDADGNLMAYQPPMFGKKIILNFTATALPRYGAHFLFLGMTCSVIAYMLAGGRYVPNDEVIEAGQKE